MITSGAARLTDWGVLRASGEEAAKFLHGQLTQDIMLMAPTQARLAGFCSAKGRLLASFIAWRPTPDEVLMAMPVELLPAVLKRLSMFVLRAKCKLSDASAQFALWGVVGDGGPAEVWQRSGDAIRLPDAAGQCRYLLARAADAAAPALPAITEAQWRWLDVQSGLAWVRGTTVEQFVPQMINLELLGGVNFQKGCYPGQEIVARSQYRGTIKRRTFLFDSEAAATIGQEIFHSGDADQPAGLVAGVAPSPNGGYSLLAEVKMAALAAGSLHLGSVSGAELKARPLPYDIDVDVTE